MVERVPEPLTLNFSPEFFLFTLFTETQHVPKQSYILLIKPENPNQSCTTESVEMLSKTKVARFFIF